MLRASGSRGRYDASSSYRVGMIASRGGMNMADWYDDEDLEEDDDDDFDWD